MCSVLSPGSVLLSANGSLAFKSCARYEDVASFTAPEVQQGHAASTRTAAEKVGKPALVRTYMYSKISRCGQVVQKAEIVRHQPIAWGLHIQYWSQKTGESVFIWAEMNVWIMSLSSDGCVLTGDDSLLVRWLSSTSKPGTLLPLLSLAQTHSCTFLVLARHPFWLSPVSSQPVQLSAELECLLLSMCEDMVVRRTDLLTVLETCELHHKASMLPPAERLVRQLVEDVYRNSVSVWVLVSAG